MEINVEVAAVVISGASASTRSTISATATSDPDSAMNTLVGKESPNAVLITFRLAARKISCSLLFTQLTPIPCAATYFTCRARFRELDHSPETEIAALLVQVCIYANMPGIAKPQATPEKRAVSSFVMFFIWRGIPYTTVYITHP